MSVVVMAPDSPRQRQGATTRNEGFPEMDDVLRAIHETVLDAEPKVLAHQMGMSHTTLLNRTNPNDDSHRLNLQQFLQILALTKDMRALRALANALGFDLVALKDEAAASPAAALMHMNAEVADVTRALADALDDNQLNQMEKGRIVREADQAIDALQALKDSVRAA